LKTIKRYKGTKAGLDLSTAVSIGATDARWGVQTVTGTADTGKFYTVGQKVKITANEATGTKTDHYVTTIVVVPRHSGGSKLSEVTTANTDSMLKHTVCMREKTSGTTCPTGTTTTTSPIAIPFNEARFFNQIATVTLGGNKDAYDKVETAQEWSVNGDCNSATAMPKCKLFYKTLGNGTAGTDSS